jgi:hypothetical protein
LTPATAASGESGGRDVPIALIAHASTRVRLPALG